LRHKFIFFWYIDEPETHTHNCEVLVLNTGESVQYNNIDIAS